jgi:hypothetical protein
MEGGIDFPIPDPLRGLAGKTQDDNEMHLVARAALLDMPRIAERARVTASTSVGADILHKGEHLRLGWSVHEFLGQVAPPEQS